VRNSSKMDCNNNKEVDNNNPGDVLKETESSSPLNDGKGETPTHGMSGLPAEFLFAWIHAGGSKFIVKAGREDIPYPAFPISDPFLSGSCWMVRIKWEGWSSRKYSSVECSCCERIDMGEGNTRRKRSPRHQRNLREPHSFVAKPRKLSTRKFVFEGDTVQHHSKSQQTGEYWENCSPASALTVVTPETAQCATPPYSRAQLPKKTKFSLDSSKPMEAYHLWSTSARKSLPSLLICDPSDAVQLNSHSN
jgi:hypothetical protein